MIFDMHQMIPPPPHDAFEWRTTFPRQALVCPALEEHARHMVSTRAWTLGSSLSPLDDEEGWGEVASAMHVEPEALARVCQVHGNAVVVVDGAHRVHRGAPLQDGDIVVTDDPECAIAVQGADCVPLLVADVTGRAVAAAHAGWRGMTARVPEATVAGLARIYGSRPENLMVAVGPSIGACCYQVGGDVRDAFAEAGFSSSQLDRWFLDRPVASEANPSMLATLPVLDRSASSAHWFLDLWAIVREQLEGAGVRPDRILMAGLCTASHPDALCSYRRDGRHAGRLAAAIRPLRRP